MGDGIGSPRMTSRALYSDLRVLAVNRDTGTLTVEVREADVEFLASKLREGRVVVHPGHSKPDDSRAIAARASALAEGRTQSDEDSLVTTRVLVATRDLPSGVLLKRTDLEWQSAPDIASINNYFMEGRTTRSGLRGALLQRATLVGQPVLAADVILAGEPGYLSKVLAPGKRAVSVEFSSGTAVGGFISPGDRVDVILAHEIEGGDSDDSGGDEDEDGRDDMGGVLVWRMQGV